jgi:nucleoside 2-deoxyribosyltransferase
MKIYIAGRLSQRPELHLIRQQIWSLGHEVVSTWIDESGDGALNGTAKRIATRDLCQISSADLLILDTTSPLSPDGGGGREFEYGFAIGQFQHKTTWRVGPMKNAFHALVDQEFETWDDALKTL